MKALVPIMPRGGRALAVLTLAATLAAGAVAEETLLDSSAGIDWPGYGRSFGEQHFSPLTQIDAKDVSRLSLAWSYNLGPSNSVTAPVEADGVLYFVTGYSVVHALEARTGRLLWEFDPKAPEASPRKLRLAWGTRGLAWWKGKVYVGTQDGRLIAIDAKTGKQVWSAMTLSPDDTNSITGAPRVFDGKVIIGFGGADLGPARGYVSTYDAETGRLLWRWYTVPGDPAKGFENDAMRMAAQTWSGDWWKYGGGGTVWNAMAYDPETDSVFIGTGNGSPWNHKARSQGKGDNLFLASIVALDGETGQYKWHYQVNPGESWDYNATMDIELADLEIGGRTRKVLMTAPKNGFFYVIDRTDGKLISAEPFAKVNWASRIDTETGRPVEDPAARYPAGTTFLMWPSSIGAHSWFPMAFSPRTRFAYIPVIEKAQTWTDFEVEGEQWRKDTPLMTSQAAARTNPFPETHDPLDGTSRLVAWDVAGQKPAWSQPTPGLAGGGVLATAGNLVFQGRLDGLFKAYAADSGTELWSFDGQAPVMAPPISYSVAGRQYVTVLTGMSTSLSVFATPASRYNTDYRTQPRRVLTFAIGGRAKLPRFVRQPLVAADDPEFLADVAQAQRGAAIYRRCTSCHGLGAEAGGNAPDLRTSAIPVSAGAFDEVVRGGALVSLGMPRFDELSDDQLADLRQFLRSQAAKLRTKPGG